LSPSSIISFTDFVLKFQFARQKKGFLSKKKGHVELDPELEMYREKGIINGQEVAICALVVANALLFKSFPSKAFSGNVSTTPTS
jgi:hypothetical protein